MNPLQSSLFGDDALPAGLTPLQRLVARALMEDPQANVNDAVLTFRCWLLAGLERRVPAHIQEAILDFLQNGGPGALNPESFTRRRRELWEMGLFRPSPEEIERRERLAHAGPPRW